MLFLQNRKLKDLSFSTKNSPRNFCKLRPPGPVVYIQGHSLIFFKKKRKEKECKIACVKLTR